MADFMLCRNPNCNMPVKPNEMIVVEKSGPNRGKPVRKTGTDINWTAKYGYCGTDHYVEDMTEEGSWGSEDYQASKRANAAAQRFGKAMAGIER